MDSPTLASFNYDQFWLEIYKSYEYNFSNIGSNMSPTTTMASEMPSPQTEKETVRVKKTENNDSYKATKNIAKNYGKAISTFATSKIALPYITPILQEYHLTLDQFLDYMRLAKKSIRGIDSFRSLLLVNKEDDSILKAKKKAFQAVGIIFIKYFSVNWIMNGKLTHKIIYLKYRFKMLRRISDPASFTYLQCPKSMKKKL